MNTTFTKLSIDEKMNRHWVECFEKDRDSKIRSIEYYKEENTTFVYCEFIHEFVPTNYFYDWYSLDYRGKYSRITTGGENIRIRDRLDRLRKDVS